MPVLATWAPEDGVLGAVAPLALATTQSTALVLDLDPNGPEYKSERTVRDLVVDGPRAADLSPPRRGVAVFANGGIEPGDALETVRLLAQAWPHVVVRLGPSSPPAAPFPVVAVRLLFGELYPERGRAVYQPIGRHQALEYPGNVLLPRVRRRAIAGLLSGRRPVTNGWSRAWRQVWGMPW